MEFHVPIDLVNAYSKYFAEHMYMGYIDRFYIINVDRDTHEIVLSCSVFRNHHDCVNNLNRIDHVEYKTLDKSLIGHTYKLQKTEVSKLNAILGGVETYAVTIKPNSIGINIYVNNTHDITDYDKW